MVDSQGVLQRLTSGIGACASVYFVVLLRLFKVYTIMDHANPVLLTSYISVLHLVVVPMLWYAAPSPPRKSLELFAFAPRLTLCASHFAGMILNIALWLNGSWLLGCVIEIILIFAAFDSRIRRQFETNPLHHILLLVYAGMSIAMEVMLVIRRNTIPYQVAVDVETGAKPALQQPEKPLVVTPPHKHSAPPVPLEASSRTPPPSPPATPAISSSAASTPTSSPTAVNSLLKKKTVKRAGSI